MHMENPYYEIIQLFWINIYEFGWSYLTSSSLLATIQYTLHFFRREPTAINCDTWQPYGNVGRFGICPVQWAMATISGASFTSTLIDGVDRPGS